jgi:hypothetical protein
MSKVPTNSKSQLIEFFKVIGAVLALPLILFTVFNNIFEQPLISLLVTLIIAILSSVWLVRFQRINFSYIMIAWLSFAVIILLGFVIWPKAMTLEGYVNDSNGNPIARETVKFFDYTGRIYETQTDRSGFYQFVDVPTGKYKIRVRTTEIQGETKGLLVRVVSQSISVDSESALVKPTLTVVVTEVSPTQPPQQPESTDTPVPTITPYCPSITKEQIAQLQTIQGVEGALKKIGEFSSDRIYKNAGDVIPANVVIVTDLGTTDYGVFNVIPINNSEGLGLFLTTKKIILPDGSAYWCVKE